MSTPIVRPSETNPFYSLMERGKFKSPKEMRLGPYGMCKGDGCYYERKIVPSRKWVEGDGIYMCPCCGWGIAPFIWTVYLWPDGKETEPKDITVLARCLYYHLDWERMKEFCPDSDKQEPAWATLDYQVWLASPEINQSLRSVRQEISISRNLDREVLEVLLRYKPPIANSKTKLLKLSRMDKDDQKKVIERMIQDIGAGDKCEQLT